VEIEGFKCVCVPGEEGGVKFFFCVPFFLLDFKKKRTSRVRVPLALSPHVPWIFFKQELWGLL